MNLKGAVAVVTGAGRGIGRSVATTLARNGATVVLTARSAGELESVKSEIEAIGARAFAISADLTRSDDVKNLFAKVIEQCHRIDVLVNNAGIGRFAPVREMPLEDFDAMWALNMKAVFECTKHALPIMEAQKQGAIINVASLAGKNSFVSGAGYSATKWALLGFARSLMLEEREFNIRVITICPGSVDTTFSSTKSDPKRSEKILHPQDVADSIMAALMMPDRAMISEIDIRPTNPK
jgi:3-oxoacyl-[acyl-carrier protein] reductase